MNKEKRLPTILVSKGAYLWALGLDLEKTQVKMDVLPRLPMDELRRRQTAVELRVEMEDLRAEMSLTRRG